MKYLLFIINDLCLNDDDYYSYYEFIHLKGSGGGDRFIYYINL